MDANEFLMNGGARAASFPTVGTTVHGVVCGEAKVQQQTDPKDGSPKFFPNGEPMRVLIVPIQTDIRETPDDDGVRSLWIGGKTVGLLRDAIRAAGSNGLEQGAWISQTYVADGEKKPGLNAAKIYSIEYRRPAPGANADAHLMSGETLAPYPQITLPPSAQPHQTTPVPARDATPPAPVGIPAAPFGIDPAKWQQMSPDQRSAVQAALAAQYGAGY